MSVENLRIKNVSFFPTRYSRRENNRNLANFHFFVNFFKSAEKDKQWLNWPICHFLTHWGKISKFKPRLFFESFRWVYLRLFSFLKSKIKSIICKPKNAISICNLGFFAVRNNPSSELPPIRRFWQVPKGKHNFKGPVIIKFFLNFTLRKCLLNLCRLSERLQPQSLPEILILIFTKFRNFTKTVFYSPRILFLKF